MKLEALITPQNIFYTDNIHSEIKRLDEVVQDLGRMLEITTDSDRPFDVIHLPNVIQKTLLRLTNQIEQSGVLPFRCKSKWRIYIRYKRFHTHVGGKELGLFLVKTKVELLKDKVEVSSYIDSGTTFSILLPNSR